MRIGRFCEWLSLLAAGIVLYRNIVLWLIWHGEVYPMCWLWKPYTGRNGGRKAVTDPERSPKGKWGGKESAEAVFKQIHGTVRGPASQRRIMAAFVTSAQFSGFRFVRFCGWLSFLESGTVSYLKQGKF